MNCRRFQKRLPEYVDGALSRGRKAAAEAHLARCSACREAVQREQHIARCLSREFEQSTESIALGPDTVRRVMTALQRETPPVVQHKPIMDFWGRFAWPAAIAASLLIVILLLNQFFSGARAPNVETARTPERGLQTPISIHVLYRVPIYTFRKEGNFVADVLACSTNVVSETLWVENQKPVEPERKMPL